MVVTEIAWTCKAICKITCVLHLRINPQLFLPYSGSLPQATQRPSSQAYRVISIVSTPTIGFDCHLTLSFPSRLQHLTIPCLLLAMLQREDATSHRLLSRFHG